jgi:signal transduction histidine kinase
VPVVQDDFLSIARNRVRLVPVLQQMLDEIRPAWPDCVFRLGLNDDSEVVADEHLRSVIRNVLFNAASFSPPDGVVNIRVRADGMYARIYVDDEGPGVNPDRVETIFDPYAPSSRGPENTTTQIRQGMGIGLSIARTIVRGYGGDLRCHANANGAGGRFEIMLPLASPEGQGGADGG